MNEKYNDLFTKEFLEEQYYIQGKSKSQIAKENNVKESTLYRYFDKHNLETRDRHFDLLNKEINDYIVLEFLGKDNKTRSMSWRCRCKCGKEKTLLTRHLMCGDYKSCGCRKTTGYKEICGEYWGHAKDSAKQRNIKFDIDISYGWQLFEQQNRRCYFSGLELKFCTSVRNVKMKREPPQSASLDRLYSDKGYVEGNVVWVHRLVNIMKSIMTPDEFVTMCNLISKNFTNFETIDFDSINLDRIDRGVQFV